MWREVEVVGVGDVSSLFSARAFVWGDVDPHGGGLGAATWSPKWRCSKNTNSEIQRFKDGPERVDGYCRKAAVFVPKWRMTSALLGRER